MVDLENKVAGLPRPEMTEAEREEYSYMLQSCNKPVNAKNLKLLHYYKHGVFHHEKKQEKHRGLYFYKFFYHYLKWNIKDKVTYDFHHTHILWSVFFVFVCVALTVLSFSIYEYSSLLLAKDKSNWVNLSSIVILSTTIITASFFIVKLFVDNQIKRSEREMLKEYLQAIEKVKSENSQEFEKVNQKFDGVNEKFDGVNEKFDGVNEKFDGVNEKFDEIKELIINMEQNKVNGRKRAPRSKSPKK